MGGVLGAVYAPDEDKSGPVGDAAGAKEIVKGCSQAVIRLADGAGDPKKSTLAGSSP